MSGWEGVPRVLEGEAMKNIGTIAIERPLAPEQDLQCRRSDTCIDKRLNHMPSHDPEFIIIRFEPYGIECYRRETSRNGVTVKIITECGDLIRRGIFVVREVVPCHRVVHSIE